MAVRLGEGIHLALSAFNMTVFGCLASAGYLNGQSVPYYIMSVIAPFLLCLWHIWSFDYNDPKDSWKVFKVRLETSSPVHGLILMLRRIPGWSLWCGDGLWWIGHGPLLQACVPLRLTLHFLGTAVLSYTLLVVQIFSSVCLSRGRLGGVIYLLRVVLHLVLG